MSPPIRDGSGSSIGSVRLGDGSEISEVRTGAGDVLFSAIPDSGISRFEFEQVLADAWNGNDGTGTGGITYTTDNQVDTYAVVLDGTDDVIDLGPMGDLEGLSELSILGWIKPKSGTLDGSNYGVYWQSDGDFTEQFGVRFGRDGDTLGFTPNGENDVPIGTTYSNLSTGTWYHFAGVFDGTNSSYYWYLDASQDASNTSASTSQIPSASNNGKFGIADDWGLETPIDLDHVEFHSKALTQTEVQNHRDTGSING